MKNYFKALSVSALSLFGSAEEVKSQAMDKEIAPQETVYTPKDDKAKKQDELSKKLQEARLQKNAKTVNVQFQTDTIAGRQNMLNQTDAYLEMNSGRIVVPVYENSNTKPSEHELYTNASHENKHAQNMAASSSNLGVKQFYKNAVLDETSGQITTVLCWREAYLGAQDKEKFLEDASRVPLSMNRSPLGYFQAISDGEVKPESKNPKDFADEMSFIAKSEFAWLASSNSSYKRDFESLTVGYMNNQNNDFTPNEAEFERVSKAYMTIGGIDFRQYLDKDYLDQIDVPEGVEKADLYLQKGDKNIDNAQSLLYNGMVYDGSVSLEQYDTLLQHKKIANSVIYNIGEREAAHLKSGGHDYDASVTASYNIFKGKSAYSNLNGKNELKQFADDNMRLALSSVSGNIPDNTEEFEKKLKEIYTLPNTGVDLRKHIEGFDVANVPFAENKYLEEFKQDPEKYKENNPYQRRVTSPLVHNIGDVKWQEHSADNRVSEVMTVEVLDVGSGFLKAELDERLLIRDMEELKKQQEKKTPIENRLNMEDSSFNAVFKQQDDYRVVKTVGHDGECSVSSFKNGKLDGLQLTFGKDGSPKDVRMFEDGKEQKETNFKFIDIKNDSKRAYGVELDGQKEGLFVIENEDGKVEGAKVFRFGNEVFNPNLKIEENRTSAEEKNVKDISSLVEKGRTGHSTIQAMREKLAGGHEDKFAFLKVDGGTAQKLRDLRFSSVSRSSGTTTPTELSADKIRRLQGGKSMG